MATEKKVASLLVDETSFEKVSMICDTIGLVYSGLGPDARLLLAESRKAAQKYKNIYNEYPPVNRLVQDIAGIMQEYTQSG